MAAADDRAEIPLRMLKGNLDVLLDNTLECNSIRLIHDPGSTLGVLILIGFSPEQKVAAKALGFRTAKIGGE